MSRYGRRGLSAAMVGCGVLGKDAEVSGLVSVNLESLEDENEDEVKMLLAGHHTCVDSFSSRPKIW